MKQLLTDVCVDASLENVSYLRKRITRILEKLELNQETINTVQLAFSEVASNFIEHSASIKKLVVKLYYSRSSLSLCVTEYATEDNHEKLNEWLNDVAELKNSPQSPLDVFDLERSGGRGAGLIAKIVDNIEYTQLEHRLNEKSITVQGYTLNWAVVSPEKKKRILIVDDDRSLTKLYESYLSQVYEVTCAESVEKALYLIDEQVFELILSDIHMPVYNGIEFREKVSSHNKAMNIPFIFMSGDRNADKYQALSRLGIDDFLTKPITKSQLLSHISRTITRVEQLGQLNDLMRTQSITQSLLPSVPKDLHNWRVGAISEGPNSGGGDLLIVKRQGNSTLIVVADLMGHDIAAKFFSHAYLGYIRGVLCASSPEPDEFLQLLSNALYEDELLSKSLCTCCAIKLTEHGTMHIASAGHPAPMVISKDHLKTLEVEGMLPGLMPNIVYASKECSLKKGERLAIFTDGFIDPSETTDMTTDMATDMATESIDNKSHLENETLAALMQSLNTPIEASLKTVFRIFNRVNDNHLIDDALLVLVEPVTDTDEQS